MCSTESKLSGGWLIPISTWCFSIIKPPSKERLIKGGGLGQDDFMPKEESKKESSN